MHLCFTFSIFSLLLPRDIYVNYKLALVKSICQRLNYNREEGSGNPLQYSCLEKSLDRAAWRAAVYGVAQRWTRLKRLSSSSRTTTGNLPASSAEIEHCAAEVDCLYHPLREIQGGEQSTLSSGETGGTGLLESQIFQELIS